MKFRVRSSWCNCSIEYAEKLKKIGFKFTDGTSFPPDIKWIDSSEEVFINIETIDELMHLKEEFGCLLLKEDMIELFNPRNENQRLQFFSVKDL
jgi:hypothetical protein